MIEAIAWHNDSWRLKEGIRIEKLSLVWSNRATAVWLSIAREIGRLLLAMPMQSGARTPGFLRDTPRLSDLGLKKKQSHEYQLLARIPDDLFREYLWDRIHRGVQITKAEALFIARGFVGATPSAWQGPRPGIGDFLRMPAEVLSDIVHAAHGAADDIEEGAHVAHALAAALDSIMERLGGLAGRRSDWDERRRVIEQAILREETTSAGEPLTRTTGGAA